MKAADKIDLYDFEHRKACSYVNKVRVLYLLKKKNRKITKSIYLKKTMVSLKKIRCHAYMIPPVFSMCIFFPIAINRTQIFIQ